MWRFALILFGAWKFAVGQDLSCSNYGTPNGSSCACPPGFGGQTCAQPACSGTIFQGSQRQLASTPSVFPNLTASSCSCADGWGGTGCNVCLSSNACRTALSSSGFQPSTSAGLNGNLPGSNGSLTCSAIPKVYAAGMMSCNVNNPTLQAIYPLQSTLNILRTLQPSLSPLPNTTSFGPENSLYAQLFYDGVEQFYCTANSCSQTLGNGSAAVDWTCQNLQCTCISNTTFCGAVKASTLNATIDGLVGTLEITCQEPAAGSSTATCAFKQQTIQNVFGQAGLSLEGCAFGECVSQDVIDTASSGNTTTTTSGGKSLSGGVIAGLAVVGALLLLLVLVLLVGFYFQRRARLSPANDAASKPRGVAVEWSNISYTVPSSSTFWGKSTRGGADGFTSDKVILDSITGCVRPGEMLAILGPSGAGKTTLVEILADKHKAGRISGSVAFPTATDTNPSTITPSIAFIPQQDVLPPQLTVYEYLLFAARLRLPESVPEHTKRARVDEIISQLGLEKVRHSRIGDGERRGISGGELRRVSIGVELVGKPDIMILDEPTSGLDSVSAATVAKVLDSVAKQDGTTVIASIHQPSSKLYHTFSHVLVLAHGRSLYFGLGGMGPVRQLSQQGIPPPDEGYNVADFLLEVASDPSPGAFMSKPRGAPFSPVPTSPQPGEKASAEEATSASEGTSLVGRPSGADGELEKGTSAAIHPSSSGAVYTRSGGRSNTYATTFLTQLQVLSGREWKNLCRDYTLFLTHITVAAVLGVFCGGLYFHTGVTIAGFQSRVGCLFFIGALIAFSSLSALYNVVEIRSLFLRERSARYYSPTAWLLSRVIWDIVPLRIIPTIVVSTITYWMAGLAHDAAHFFKFLFIVVLYAILMALFNFLLAFTFHNGGIAILLSALTALYQMTYAGFFVHLTSIPPVLRWLQWLCPLKYTLEALSVNEVGSGLMIQDTLEGVPVNISASVIMQLLFGFGLDNYYRDVLVLFAFIAGFGIGVIGVVWIKVREMR